mmetsp:Transcript_9597/g.19425  ORF Transcript_9597/g.19425 Transcript_9597/m.19425 type:complete len:217 (-) Transcript_9597:409-1059(-)
MHEPLPCAGEDIACTGSVLSHVLQRYDAVVGGPCSGSREEFRRTSGHDDASVAQVRGEREEGGSHAGRAANDHVCAREAIEALARRPRATLQAQCRLGQVAPYRREFGGGAFRVEVEHYARRSALARPARHCVTHGGCGAQQLREAHGAPVGCLHTRRAHIAPAEVDRDPPLSPVLCYVAADLASSTEAAAHGVVEDAVVEQLSVRPCHLKAKDEH